MGSRKKSSSFNGRAFFLAEVLILVTAYSFTEGIGGGGAIPRKDENTQCPPPPKKKVYCYSVQCSVLN